MSFHEHLPSWRGQPLPATRATVEDEIERLIALLDTMDGDCDLEPTMGASNDNQCGSQTGWAHGRLLCDECEEENEHGGDVQDEPHDDGADDEPSLGWNSIGEPGSSLDFELCYAEMGL